MWYNEAGIAPLFLKHYEYLDEIHILFETDTDDGTRKILEAAPNVVIHDIHIEGGIDDIAKVAMVNAAILSIDTDWLYVLDSDEFILPPFKEHPHTFLKRQVPYHIVIAAMYQVYRHRTDHDIDYSKPPLPQRLHGDSDLFSGVQSEHRDCNRHYIKPIIIRPKSGVQYSPGNHVIAGTFYRAYTPHLIAEECFYGAHWQMADPGIAVTRRMQRKERMSEKNKMYKMGFQHHTVTEEYIIAECGRHLDDPEIDILCQSI